MRNKRETDISQYTEETRNNNIPEIKTESGAKKFFKGFGRLLLTVVSVCMVALIITGISIGIYIYSLASEPTGIDLTAKSMNQTSF